MSQQDQVTTFACPAEIAEAVVAAKSQHVPLVDYGLAHDGLGHAPPEPHRRYRLASSRAGGVVEHYVADFTVRLDAGAAVGEIREALARERQFLPLDADDDLTLGEVLMHNVYGPMRLGFGSVRDWTLGLHYIDGAGRDIHVGGRTVKNVAGYDVARFLIGSLGEFGIVHEATLRTYAIPERVMVVDIEVHDPATLDSVVPAWLLTDAAPVSMLLHHDAQRWKLRVSYAGRLTACAAQLRSLETFIEEQRGLHIVGSGDYDLQDDVTQRAARRVWRRSAAAVVKVIVPPASTGSVCRAIRRWLTEQAIAAASIDAQPAFGCIFTGGALSGEQARSLDAMLSHVLPGEAALRVWHRRPAGGEPIAPVAPPQSDWPMLRRLKAVMDPHRLFNPGRLLQVEADQT